MLTLDLQVGIIDKACSYPLLLLPVRFSGSWSHAGSWSWSPSSNQPSRWSPGASSTHILHCDNSLRHHGKRKLPMSSKVSGSWSLAGPTDSIIPGVSAMIWKDRWLELLWKYWFEKADEYLDHYWQYENDTLKITGSWVRAGFKCLLESLNRTRKKY